LRTRHRIVRGGYCPERDNLYFAANTSAPRNGDQRRDRGDESVTRSDQRGSPLVYIVDDDRDVRDSIVFMLRTDGIASHAFADAGSFLDALPALQPGCLLIDIRMPETTGLDLLNLLIQRGCSWPAVIMTGHGERDLAERALSLGARDFIEKPFDADLLLHCLRRLARTHL
jgi:FixJ family two-component response regulator